MFRSYLSRAVGALTVGACALALSAAAPVVSSGRVLPPSATPLGWSIDDMASAVINFTTSGNDPSYYPDTPFQILYHFTNHDDPALSNTFVVPEGTYLYAKFFEIDDSFPVIGDWPETKEEAANYIFGRDQIGGHDFQIIVDGKSYSLQDPGYIGGPVATPDSPDGSENGIQIGAFISPLKKGTHTVVIHGTVDGDAFIDVVGGPSTGNVTLTVIVE
jgi:hypothetical protein